MGTRVVENQSICIQLMMLKNDTVIVTNIFLISGKLVEGLVKLIGDALVFLLLVDKLIF